MLCKDQWIDISWSGQKQRVQRENLQVKFLRKAKSLISFDDACDQAAKEIYQQHKNLYLGLSGGADSEYVATCLHRNNIPFTPLILQYNNTEYSDQKYESWYAKHWCKSHDIAPVLLNLDDYVGSWHDTASYEKLKPRLWGGAITAGLLCKFVEEHHGQLVSGFQLEYYPDHEQMTYLQPQLHSYQGFVMEESDFYIEQLSPERHPWAFYYWSPEIMAAYVDQWDVNLTMTENKALIYGTTARPKFDYPRDMLSAKQRALRKKLALEKWGTLDCALLGPKEQLLVQLTE